MTTRETQTTENKPKENYTINKNTFRDVSNYNNSTVGLSRIPLGSKKEFQFKIISDNWLLDNIKLGVLLGISAGRVSHIRRDMRSKPNMLEMAFNDYMVLKNRDTIPDSLKYNGTVKLLTMLVADDKNKLEELKQNRLDEGRSIRCLGLMLPCILSRFLNSGVHTHNLIY